MQTTESTMRDAADVTAIAAPGSLPPLTLRELTVSVIVPVFNERGTLEQLYREVTEELEQLVGAFEIIIIDDGSSDGSTDVLAAIAARDPRVRLYVFRSNQGKAAALNWGFRQAEGDVVITMDADLQDKPSEISKLLAGLDGVDLASGWKRQRHDPLGKTLPSKFFNWVTRTVSGVSLNDFNCGFKAYRREVVQELDLYGELHRFIPVLAAFRGFRTREVPVEHAPRVWGKSKYGWSRLFKGAYDLLTVVLLTRFETRPLHFFGSIGAVLGALGFGVLLYMSYLRLVLDQVIGRRPLLFLGIVLFLTGVQLLSVGLIGELIVRRTRRSEPRPPLRVQPSGVSPLRRASARGRVGAMPRADAAS
ncbi:MAG TPA: glycosyltransferase family 2 protein [Gemmatimonadaceae bacterium]|nr:glycosyltransferase family 2 protein [Gemmatimonadaceae bacterium]